MAAAIPQLKHLASEIDGTAISTGLVSGGTTANTVAEHASVTFDLRYGSDRDRDELIFRMRKLFLTGFADGVTSDLKIESLGPALPLSAESASLITLINRAAATLRLPSPADRKGARTSRGRENRGLFRPIKNGKALHEPPRSVTGYRTRVRRLQAFSGFRS